MSKKKGGELPEDIAAVGRRIRAWRKTRKKGKAMPEELWAAATALARIYGVGAISRTLRVGYRGLRDRARMAQVVAVDSRDAAVAPQDQATAFVELQPASFTTGPRCIVELREASGTTMKIQLMDPGALDLTTLMDVFWSCHRCSR